MKQEVLNEYSRCVSCGCKDTHNMFCDLIDIDQAKEEIKKLYNQFHKKDEEFQQRKWKDNKVYFALKKDVSFWQGKFNIVKHENNILRKKLKKYETI